MSMARQTCLRARSRYPRLQGVVGPWPPPWSCQCCWIGIRSTQSSIRRRQSPETMPPSLLGGGVTEDGILIEEAVAGANERVGAYALAVQPDGRIVVAGTAGLDPNSSA